MVLSKQIQASFFFFFFNFNSEMDREIMVTSNFVKESKRLPIQRLLRH